MIKLGFDMNREGLIKVGHCLRAEYQAWLAWSVPPLPSEISLSLRDGDMLDEINADFAQFLGFIEACLRLEAQLSSGFLPESPNNAFPSVELKGEDLAVNSLRMRADPSTPSFPSSPNHPPHLEQFNTDPLSLQASTKPGLVDDTHELGTLPPLGRSQSTFGMSAGKGDFDTLAVPLNSLPPSSPPSSFIQNTVEVKRHTGMDALKQAHQRSMEFGSPSRNGGRDFDSTALTSNPSDRLPAKELSNDALGNAMLDFDPLAPSWAGSNSEQIGGGLRDLARLLSAGSYGNVDAVSENHAKNPEFNSFNKHDSSGPSIVEFIPPIFTGEGRCGDKEWEGKTDVLESPSFLGIPPAHCLNTEETSRHTGMDRQYPLGSNSEQIGGGMRDLARLLSAGPCGNVDAVSELVRADDGVQAISLVPQAGEKTETQTATPSANEVHELTSMQMPLSVDHPERKTLENPNFSVEEMMRMWGELSIGFIGLPTMEDDATRRDGLVDSSTINGEWHRLLSPLRGLVARKASRDAPPVKAPSQLTSMPESTRYDPLTDTGVQNSFDVSVTNFALFEPYDLLEALSQEIWLDYQRFYGSS